MGFLSNYLPFRISRPIKPETRIDRRIWRMYERLRKVDGRVLFYVRGNKKVKIK